MSVFIDESGDFGEYDPRCPFYLVALVFHDQRTDITGGVEHLKRQVIETGFPRDHAIHTAPLVRREKDYANVDMPVRRKLFRHLFDFARVCDITFTVIAVRKKDCPGRAALVARIARELGALVRDDLTFFQSFDKVIVYYDGGQHELSTVINAVFNTLVEAEVRKVRPSDYCLFQAADMFCTLELARLKLEGPGLSASEEAFFRGARALRKNYLRPIERKRR